MTDFMSPLSAKRPVAVDTPPLDYRPELWKNDLKPKAADQNKYDHGHVLVYGGEHLTGAACLAAHGAMRVGAGLCTISATAKAANVYRSYLPVIMVEDRRKTKDFRAQMKDRRRNAILIGPGAGQEQPDALRHIILKAARDGRPCVFDADALTVFKDQRRKFYRALGPHCVLTPHEGEFARIIPGLQGTKAERARQAAQKSGAVVLLKGAETIIAAPDGRIAVNTNAPPDLATGGAGDVLSGMVVGLLARGVPPFEAACAAAWIHGRAAQMFGIGLMATDLLDRISAVLQELT
jgi:hydroxyethylthiazole kinase-like uncharacterized protein yjeF